MDNSLKENIIKYIKQKDPNGQLVSEINTDSDCKSSA